MAIIYLHDRDYEKGRYLNISSVISEKGYSYDIEDRIGAGGHAAVYKCANSRDEYAIKFQLNNSRKNIKRFRNSIEVLKKLNHDNLLKYIDSGTVKYAIKTGTYIYIPFLIMNLYEAGDLEKKLCDEQKQYKPEEYIPNFLDLSEALGHFHKISTHRDIKPANILVGDNRWVLADYGLCTSIHGDRITRYNEKVGPLLWMTPEANNKALNVASVEIDAASDVYQLASIFWFIVNNRHPTGILKRNDWSGPDWLFKPIARALSHNKLNRYKDGRYFNEALKRAMKKSES